MASVLCILCQQHYFPDENVGSLECKFHPQSLISKYDLTSHRYNINHYGCCGLTNNPSDEFHFEQQRLPFGCTRIDHVSTRQELEALQEKPYAISFEPPKKMNYAKCDLYKDHSIFDRDNEFQFPIYDDQTFVTITTLQDEYRILLMKKLREEDDDRYNEYLQEEDTSLVIDSVVFKPFYFIRRVQCVKDAASLSLARPNKKCKFH